MSRRSNKLNLRSNRSKLKRKRLRLELMFYTPSLRKRRRKNCLKRQIKLLTSLWLLTLLKMRISQILLLRQHQINSQEAATRRARIVSRTLTRKRIAQRITASQE